MCASPRRPLLVVGLSAAVVLVGAPLAGWPAVVRLSAVLVSSLLLALAIVRPWRFSRRQWETLARWQPPPRLVTSGALVAAAVLFWVVLTRFYSGEINGVDFTVYFDRPCFQTAQGRPLFIETSDFPQYSWQSGLEHHAYWMMFPVCALYALYPTAMWLHLLSVGALIAGAFYILRILQHAGVPGIVATAAALAFLLNDNTARALQYGFHPEILFAWFIPWLVHAGLTGRLGQFAVAAVATTLVKETAVLYLAAAAVALGLNALAASDRRARVVWPALAIALGLVNLTVYYAVVIPAVTEAGVPAYAHFWATYGETPLRALIGMAADPLRVAGDTARSGFFTEVLPSAGLLLPMVGWRWILGTLPAVVIFSASSDPQLHGFGIYYSISLVPFLTLGAASGAVTVARRITGEYRAPLAAALVAAGAFLVGIGDGGYSLRPWRNETEAVPEALSRLADAPVILVQSGLYPHAGYSERVQLLTPWTLADPDNAAAAMLIAERVDAYPFTRGEIAALTHGRLVTNLPGGLVAIHGPKDQNAPVAHPHARRFTTRGRHILSPPD